MTTEVIDKLMKPYWDEKFDNTYLGDFYKENSGWRDDWYGVIIKKTDKLIVGCSIKDKDWWDDVTWFYDGKIFLNGDILFGLTNNNRKLQMVDLKSGGGTLQIRGNNNIFSFILIGLLGGGTLQIRGNNN